MEKRIYFAHHDGGAENDSIPSPSHEPADIYAFDSRAELEAFCREQELDPSTLRPGAFGDCWIKVHSEPSAETLDCSPFEWEDLTIQRPGQHPGGKAWWITPSPTVYVADFLPEED